MKERRARCFFLRTIMEATNPHKAAVNATTASRKMN
jgi:hypothetical protein